MFPKNFNIHPLFTNFFVVVTIVFVIWMLFFDLNDVPTIYKMNAQKEELEQQKEYYQENIAKIEEDIKQLRTDDKHLEKFARENYLMHKENEDVYIVVEKPFEK